MIRKYFSKLWVLSLILFCISFVDIKYIRQSGENMPINQFIIGRWIEESNSLTTNRVKLEFINSDTVLLNNGLGSNYTIEGNVLVIYENSQERQARSEWQIEQSGDQLLIRFSPSDNFSVFNRTSRVNWLIIVIGLGVLVLEVGFFIDYSILTHNVTKMVDNPHPNKQYLNKASRLVLGFLFIVGGFLFSTWVGKSSLSWLIREPWYSIILVESGLILLILGVRLYLVRGTNPWMKVIGLLLSTFLLGSSIAWLAVGFLRLINMIF